MKKRKKHRRPRRFRRRRQAAAARDAARAARGLVLWMRAGEQWVRVPCVTKLEIV